MAEPARSIFLVGFMGAGKSTVGAALAAELDRELADSDVLVERDLGRPIASVFTEAGEARFREAERRVLSALASGPPAVVACGGGAFDDPATRRVLGARGRTVWIDVPLEVVRSRLAAAGGGRPLWNADDPVGQRALFERRRAAYALAHVRIDGSAGSPRTLARRIRERLCEVLC